VIARLDTETGEISTRRLEHENGEARAFYAGLPKPVLIGIEATGYTPWFEGMVAERGHADGEDGLSRSWYQSGRHHVQLTTLAKM
jgi:hypothetical protein